MNWYKNHTVYEFVLYNLYNNCMNLLVWIRTKISEKNCIQVGISTRDQYRACNRRCVCHPPPHLLNQWPIYLYTVQLRKGRKSVIHTHRPSHFLNAAPSNFNWEYLAQRCDSLFLVILISITSLKEITNPQYLAVMINPFSITPHQKLSSPIPCLPKLIIHNTSLVVLWQIVSLAEKESFLLSHYIHP